MTPPIPYIKGMFRHVLSPPGQKSDPAKRQWYINDHCFFVAPDETIHWYGITNPYPPDDEFYGPGSHMHIGHATARSPFGPWEESADAFTLPEGSQDNIGACFVAALGSDYYMLYGFESGFTVAHSSDLSHWTNVKDVPKVFLGEGTRDPCILKHEDGYLLYCACGKGGFAITGLAKSKDLAHWEALEPALVSDVPGSWGPLESPFVLHRNGWYYLFVNHSHHQYEETLVFASKSPLKFDWTKPLCTIFAHAAEIFTWQGKTCISHCGIEDRQWNDSNSPPGLYLAELAWAD